MAIPVFWELWRRYNKAVEGKGKLDSDDYEDGIKALREADWEEVKELIGGLGLGGIKARL